MVEIKEKVTQSGSTTEIDGREMKNLRLSSSFSLESICWVQVEGGSARGFVVGCRWKVEVQGGSLNTAAFWNLTAL